MALWLDTNKAKYMVIIKWIEIDKTEYQFYNSEEEMEKWLKSFKQGAFEIIKKYELKELK
jgi:hypothetical protein